MKDFTVRVSGSNNPVTVAKLYLGRIGVEVDEVSFRLMEITYADRNLPAHRGFQVTDIKGLIQLMEIGKFCISVNDRGVFVCIPRTRLC